MNTWNGETQKEKVIEKQKWDLNHEDDGEICTYAFGPDEYKVLEMLGINLDDYQKSDSDEDSHSESNSNSNSSTESNWGTDHSVEDTDPDA